MTDYVLTGLVKKRAELSGKLSGMHEAIAQAVRDLEHLDATIKLIAPDYEPESIAPKFRPPEDWSKRGQMSRMVLSILRTAKEPLTSRDIAAKMVLERGLVLDAKLLRTMVKRVATALRDQRDRGRVTASEGPGTYLLWEVRQ